MPRYQRERDTQRRKVYNFGYEVRGLVDKIESQEDCVKFLNKAHRWWYGDTDSSCRIYHGSRFSHNCFQKLADIKVVFRTGRGRSWYQIRDRTIHIRQPWGKNKEVLLHELAHYIMGRSTRKEFQCAAWHGKIFMRIFITLLARFTDLSMTQLKAIAKKHKAKMCGLKDSNGKNIRRKLKQS
jgi:hypothetical protein